MLVGRRVSTAEAAATAAADGANFVVLCFPSDELPDAPLLEAARSTQRSGNAIPVIAGFGSGPEIRADEASLSTLPQLFASRVDGLSLPLQQAQQAASQANAAATGWTAMAQGLMQARLRAMRIVVAFVL